jgi:hypothetical protein
MSGRRIIVPLHQHEVEGLMQVSARIPVIAVAALMLSCASSQAKIVLAQKGETATLSGAIEAGDEFVFREFMRRPEARQIRTTYLSSPGGIILSAREIARDIRAAGISTVVDAARGACSSACTGIFAGGVQRYYLNAPPHDRQGGKPSGLGFHEGNSAGRHGREYSGNATAAMINIYYEMGVSGAARVVTSADWKGMFYLSGPRALELGIATSLGR